MAKGSDFPEDLDKDCPFQPVSVILESLNNFFNLSYKSRAFTNHTMQH